MERFSRGLRRLALVLGGAWVVFILVIVAFEVERGGWGRATGQPLETLVALFGPVLLILVVAEVVLFVVRGFTARD